jgi:hypothetical protein
MARLSLRCWQILATDVTQKARWTSLRKQRQSGLELELLECRCVPSTVSSLADAGPGSLRDAIAATPPGGTVQFQPNMSGTITLSSGELDIAENLTIAGPGDGALTLNGNKATRVFDIAASVTVTISGLTITGGSSDQGAGIYNLGTLTVLGSSFSSDSASMSNNPSGGAIYNAGVLTVADSNFSGDVATSAGPDASTATARGGAICNAGTLTVSQCTFTGDSALASGQDTALAGGGAIYNTGTLHVSDSTVVDSFAMAGGSGYSQAWGGAIYNAGSLYCGSSSLTGNTAEQGGGIYNVGALILSGSTLSGNSATGNAFGGGIDNQGTAAISSSTLSENDAEGGPVGWGGGIANSGNLAIIRCTLSANRVSGGAAYGGGIYNDTANLEGTGPGTLTVLDSTIADNTAQGGGLPQGGGSADGGGIANGGVLIVLSSTVSGNSAVAPAGKALGGGIDNDAVGILPGAVSIQDTILAGNSAAASCDGNGFLHSLGHNLMGIDQGCSGYTNTDLIGTSATLLDPHLGPLQDNGGPTLTMALLPGSPAIDAGALTDSDWDQRGPGYPRLVNGVTDIGAYEVQDTADKDRGGDAVHPPEAITFLPRSEASSVVAPGSIVRRAATPSVLQSPAIVALDDLFALLRSQSADLSRVRLGQLAVGETDGWTLQLFVGSDSLFRYR